MKAACWPAASIWELVAEHGEAAHRVGLAGLVLDDVPMLGELAVLDSKNVGDDPVAGLAVAGEATVEDHVVTIRDDEPGFVLQRRGRRLDQVEQSGSAGRDVGAVLDVVG